MKNTRHTKNSILILVITIIMSQNVYADNMIKVNSTAYCNPNNNLTYSGEPTVEGVTAAGKKEWLGKTIAIYKIADNGLLEFYGYRTFTDTGYGKASTKYAGMGTIETGETIDIFFESRDTAIQWGNTEVFIRFIEEEEN